MNRGIYSTARGMAAATRWMDTIANNLANVSTTGYKADEITFGDTLAKRMYSSGGHGAALGTLGEGPVEQGQFTRNDVGSIRQTQNPLDIALRGEGTMFAVQGPQGQPRYTRDGAFQLDDQSRLVNKSGYPVLDDRGEAITLSSTGTIQIGADGTVTQNGNTVGKIGVFTGDFRKEGANLYVGQGAVASPNPQIVQGALENSNADAVTSMVDLIRISRHFEMTQRSIQSQDEMTGRLIDSLNRG